MITIDKKTVTESQKGLILVLDVVFVINYCVKCSEKPCDAAKPKFAAVCFWGCNRHNKRFDEYLKLLKSRLNMADN